MCKKCDILHSKAHKATKCDMAADPSHRQNVYEYLHNHWQAWGRPQSPTFLPVSNCMSVRSLTYHVLAVALKCPFEFIVLFSSPPAKVGMKNNTEPQPALQYNRTQSAMFQWDLASTDWKSACMTVCRYRRLEHYLWLSKRLYLCWY